MPNKTIYVAERVLSLFDRAQELAGGNLSSAITQALERYVEINSAKEQGMDEVIVDVGQPGMRRRQRFVGRPIAFWQRRLADSVYERFVVYRTAKGRYAVHTRRDWSPVPLSFDSDVDRGIPGRHVDTDRPYLLDVFDTVDEMKEKMPPELAAMVEEVGNAPEVEDLDI